jgi:hypothetical protein
MHRRPNAVPICEVGSKAGKKQLAAEKASWARTITMMQRMLGDEG